MTQLRKEIKDLLLIMNVNNHWELDLENRRVIPISSS
jgi:hypothetical protein